MICYYCGDPITGASVNSKHPQCAGDLLMHRRSGVIFSSANVAAWLRDRAGKLRDIGVLTGEESMAMVVALNLAGAADAIESGEIARWTRARDADTPYVCKCDVCRCIRERNESRRAKGMIS